MSLGLFHLYNVIFIDCSPGFLATCACGFIGPWAQWCEGEVGKASGNHICIIQDSEELYSHLFCLSWLKQFLNPDSSLIAKACIV